MACFKYRIINNGVQKAFGGYTKDSTGVEGAWYCPPSMAIELSDVRNIELYGDDPEYFNSYVTVIKIGSCGSAPAVSNCAVIIEDVVVTPNTAIGLNTPNGEAIIQINEAVNPYEYSIDGVFYQPLYIFASLREGDYIAYVRNASDHACYATRAFTILSPTPELFTSVSSIKNPTQVGASDGEIKATILDGSGNYTVKYSFDNIVHPLDSGDPIQSMIKVGLPAGEHTVTIVDIANGATKVSVVTLINPAVVVELPGSFLDVPMMNSIHWVIEDLTEMQTPDNRLLNNQYYPGHVKTEYFQPVALEDFLITQFNTDFKNSVCELFDYHTNKLIKTFVPPVLVEKNLGKRLDFPLRIEADEEAGRSRVYFVGGPPPVPVFMDTAFEIINSNNGYNGVYKPVALETDLNLGYVYIVISKEWNQPVGTNQVFATGRFEASSNYFNVYEALHDFSDLEEGCYYGRLTVFDSLLTIQARSEPISLKLEHKKYLRLTYRNKDNDFGLAFVHGYTGVIRLPALHGHKGTPGGEHSTSRNSDATLVKVSATMFRKFPLEVWGVPRYIHEKVATLINCGYWTINGVRYQTEDGYPIPVFIEKSLLSHATITVEQVGWQNKYKTLSQSGAIAERLIATGTGGFISR